MSPERIDVILLSGGKGSRFSSITHNKIYKSLYKVNNSELFKYSTDLLDFSLVNRLIFAVDSNSKGVIQWVKKQGFPCEVVFSHQTDPGVLGAVEGALNHVTANHFLVCNTDEIREGLSMAEVLEGHIQSGNVATMASTLANKLYFHRVIESDDNHRVISMDLKNQYYREFPEIIKEIHVGFVIFKRDALDYFNRSYGKDWDGMLGPLVEMGLIKSSPNARINFFNVGTAEELREAKAYIARRKTPKIRRLSSLFEVLSIRI